MGGVDRLAAAALMIVVDLRLQVVALGQKLLEPWAEVAQEVRVTRPEPVGRHAGAGKDLCCEEALKRFGDAQPRDVHPVHVILQHCQVACAAGAAAWLGAGRF